MDKTEKFSGTLPAPSGEQSAGVKMRALDSFHSSPTGTVAARATFETHRAHADDLMKRGLAVEDEGEQKSAPEPENKMAPTSDNKQRKTKKGA